MRFGDSSPAAHVHTLRRRKVGEQHGPAAQGVLAAVQTLREMNADNLRKVPADAPTAFIKPRWKPLVITPEGLDRKFYEICALSELKNALRSGDIWVKGSRQFRDFDDYLLPAEKFAALKREQALPPAINPNSDQYGRAFAAAGRAVGHRHPRPRTTSCPMPSSPSQG